MTVFFKSAGASWTMLAAGIAFCCVTGGSVRSQQKADRGRSSAPIPLSAPSEKPCLPCAVACNVSTANAVFDVHLRDGRVLQNYSSILRDTMPGAAGASWAMPQQSLRLYFIQNGHCDSSLVLPTSEVVSISTGGLGSMNAPLTLPVYPAREFHRTTANRVPASFLEITALAGYGGTDTSSRAIGFKSLYEGVEILAAPFGTLLGEKIAFAFGGELLFEGGRMRIPAMGQLRYTIFGGEKIVDSVHYTNACAIACSGSAPLPPPDTSFHEVTETGTTDPTVFLLHDHTVERSLFRPFVYVEGAYIFNGSFTGAGQNPSINPSDYGQYFFGGGIGTPFDGMFTASLGYRYMRLNLRTPCLTCVDKYILNTDVSNSVMLKLGVRF